MHNPKPKVSAVPTLKPYQSGVIRPMAASAHKKHGKPPKSSGGPAQNTNPKRNASPKPVVGSVPAPSKPGKRNTVASVDNAKPLLSPFFYGGTGHKGY